MNDFDFEVKQKKTLVASARRKKNGSKSRACSLPSDNLTPAQIRKLSGEVQQWNLNAPMDWETFKTMPKDLQAEYLRHLNERFGVGPATIGRELFHVSTSCVGWHARNNDIDIDFNGKRLNSTERFNWDYWRSGGAAAADECEEAPDEPDDPGEPDDPVEPEADPAAFDMSKLSVEWVGDFDGAAFVAQLTRLPIPWGRVRIKVEVEKL